MKHYLQSILIVLVGAIISAFLIAGMWFGFQLIVDGVYLVETMDRACVSCEKDL